METLPWVLCGAMGMLWLMEWDLRRRWRKLALEAQAVANAAVVELQGANRALALFQVALPKMETRVKKLEKPN